MEFVRLKKEDGAVRKTSSMSGHRLDEDGWHINTRCIDTANVMDVQEVRGRLEEVEVLSELA